MPPYQLKTPYICDVHEGSVEKGPINWAGMDPRPYRAIFKASGKFKDDVRRQDHEVENYVAQCKQLGIRYGLYHFLRPDDISQQAQLYKEVWDKVGGADMPPIVDVEIDLQKVKKKKGEKKINGEIWAHQIKTWLDIVEGWSGHEPIIYTGQQYWTQTFDHKGNPPKWTNEYPLWVGWYPNIDSVDANTKPAKSLMPAGWKKWSMWQYSETGRTDGYLADLLDVASDDFVAELDAQFPIM